ncbi:MAG: ribonuclease III [Coraliomargarita sp.]
MQTTETALLSKLDYDFKDRSLLELALKHPSLGLGVHDNQRLEFLGDAVLDLIIAEALYDEFPELEEGALDRMRANLVSGKALAPKARELGLAQLLEVSDAQRKHHPDPSDRMLEDAIEALIGAIYLDGGLSAAKTSVRRIFGDDITNGGKQFIGGTPKSRLQEWSQSGHKGAKPEYKLTKAEGPDHARHYEATVYLNGEQLGQGSGSSKKAAEIAAAADALEKL